MRKKSGLRLDFKIGDRKGSKTDKNSFQHYELCLLKSFR